MSDTCFAYEWGHKLLTSALHGAEENGEHQGPSKQDSENLFGNCQQACTEKMLNFSTANNV